MRQPHSNRYPDTPYGSATLAVSQRIGPGSTLASEYVDVQRDYVKSFGFRGNQRGSWYIDATMVGTQRVFTILQGTFPAGPGTLTMASFTEVVRAARARIRYSVAGSASIYYGGQAPS